MMMRSFSCRLVYKYLLCFFGGVFFFNVAIADITCNDDEYLPYNTSTCEACVNFGRLGCKGGTWSVDEDYNQGIDVVTELVESPCEAGTFLPQGASTCEPCTKENIEASKAQLKAVYYNFINSTVSYHGGSDVSSVEVSKWLGHNEPNVRDYLTKTTSLVTTDVDAWFCPGSEGERLTKDKDVPVGVSICGKNYTDTTGKKHNFVGGQYREFCSDKEQQECVTGTYRPAGKSTCVSCNTDEFKKQYPGYACKGIKKGDGDDDGLTFCGMVYGRIPSKDRTKCEKADTNNSQKYKCDAGYMSWKGYNGADNNTCVKCTEESIKEALKVLPKDMFPDQDVSKIFCPGNSNGFWQPRDDYGFPQGLDLCLPVNEGFPTYANSDHSACIRHSTGDTCPDGARGTYPDCECMYSGTMSKDETKCENMTLNKDDLQYGPDGRNAKLHKQCWTKTKPADYKKCMLFDK